MMGHQRKERKAHGRSGFFGSGFSESGARGRSGEGETRRFARMIEKTQRRKGFTIIETTLFIAISSLLFMGVVTSIGSRVSEQRYSDSVNDFAEFLRNVYNEVGNTENLAQGDSESFRYGCTIWASNDRSNDRTTDGSTGRSDCALYGKMILFNWDNEGSPYVYDLVGNAVDLYYSLEDTSSALASLRSVKAGILAFNCTNKNHSSCTLGYAGSEEKYTTPWQHRIETTETTGNNLASYVIVIARAPTDNTVHTFMWERSRVVNFADARETLNANTLASTFDGFSCAGSGCTSSRATAAIAGDDYEYKDQFNLSGEDNDGYKELTSDIDFCIDQDTDGSSNNRRRNVRINANATSADAVEIVEMDDVENACNG